MGRLFGFGFMIMYLCVLFRFVFVVVLYFLFNFVWDCNLLVYFIKGMLLFVNGF